MKKIQRHLALIVLCSVLLGACASSTKAGENANQTTGEPSNNAAQQAVQATQPAQPAVQPAQQSVAQSAEAQPSTPSAPPPEPQILAEVTPPTMAYMMISSPALVSASQPLASPLGNVNYGWIYQDWNTEEYAHITDNPFLKVLGNPLSTFSIDVDTASYSNIRRFILQQQTLPYPDSVRIEELVNYFQYRYSPPNSSEGPIAVHLSLATAPWDYSHGLLRIALRAKDLQIEEIPPMNLVFLVDTSGSMCFANRLPLVKQTLKMVTANLRTQDVLTIISYAGTAGLRLPPTHGDQKQKILAVIDTLEAYGSTAGGEGIKLAYRFAEQNFIKGGNNRIIMATDGDFNVGVSSTSELERMIEDRRNNGVFFSVFGYGMGNYKDSRLETLADKGNGTYAYIDTILEAEKIANQQLWSTLAAVAKDVKVQIEFNPAIIREYRLLGYENRLLAKEDFANDAKDAGEMGVGQSVTALYELVYAEKSEENTTSGEDEQPAFQTTAVIPSGDFMVLKLRYKDPLVVDGASTKLVKSVKLVDIESPMDEDFMFASAVAEFGMLLRNSPFKGSADWDYLIARAEASSTHDPDGSRAEFIKIAKMAKYLKSLE